MKRFIPLVAIASASLAAPPAVRHEPQAAASPRPAQRSAPPVAAEAIGQASDPLPPAVEGQDKAAFDNWLARSPGARAEVLGFESFLKGQELKDVVPTWQLVRTASDYEKCEEPGFEVAPIEEWNHIAATLRFVRRHVEPVIGEVEAVSGYRNPELNACAGGARESAHRRFFALDLVPRRAIARAGLIRSICAIHGFRGRGYDIGLGFYQGLRFHIDSKGFRRWGPNGRSATSPCATGV